MMKIKFLSILFSLALICGVIIVTNSFAEDAKPIYPAGIKPIAPYSPAIMYGNLLFISGQIPYVKGAIPENAKTDIMEQTKIVMENLKTVLSEAGMSFENVLKATVFITDMKNYGAFNKVYGPYWTDNGLTPPARAAVEVGALPGSKPGAPVLVEVSMIAGK
jgi:reactive intermediate/imine deaminase